MSTKKREGAGKLSAALYSIFANSFLILLKVIIAILTGSLGILAELFHSAFDFIASVLAYIGIKKAIEPEDESHPYGHERFENISSLFQTILLAITAIWVGYEAIQRFFKPKEIAMGEIGIAVMVITLIIDIFVAKKLHTASEKYASSALEADAYHFTSDVWSVIAVIIGLMLARFGIAIADPIAALIVAGMMIKLSISLGMKSINVLSDKAADKKTIRKIQNVLNTFKKSRKINSYHKIKTRQIGSKLLIDIHIRVPNKMTVQDSHYVAHQIKNALLKRIKLLKDMTIHIEPVKKHY